MKTGNGDAKHCSFIECYIQCQSRRNSTPAIKIEGALKSKRWLEHATQKKLHAKV